MATQALTDLLIANAPRPELAPEAQQTVTSIANTGAKKNASSSTTPVITPNSLTPQVVPQVSTPPLPTAQDKMASEFQVQAEDALKQKIAADTAGAKTSTASALDSYLKTLEQSKGITSLTADAYAAPGGVNAITPELNEINSKIQKEQLALRRSIEAIQSKGGGLKGGAQAEIANLERESFAKQADLSVIQMAIQGRYDSAKEIADRAVAAKFEEQTQKTAIAKFDYQENKDLFDKAEQREFDLLFSDRERQLEEAKANSSAIYDLGLQASQDGAPASVVERMMAAKTKEEALALGGQYIGALDREAKRANIAQSWASVAASNTNRLLALAEAGDQEAIKKLKFDPRSIEEEVDPVTRRQLEGAVDSGSNLLRLAEKYKTIIDDYGYTNRTFGNTEVLGQISSLRALMTAEYKKAETLGTLDAGVLALMSQIVGEEPTSGLFTPLTNATGRRSDKLSAQLGTFIENITLAQARDKARLGIEPSVDFSVITEDDNLEINNLMGIQTTTNQQGGFNPNSFYK